MYFPGWGEGRPPASRDALIRFKRLVEMSHDGIHDHSTANGIAHEQAQDSRAFVCNTGCLRATDFERQRTHLDVFKKSGSVDSFMRRVTPRTREFAERLFALEAKGKTASDPKAAATFHVCERLRPHLSTVMGNGGFRALLSRALTLARADVSWLRAVEVKPDGTLEGLDVLRPQLAAEEMAAGQVAVLAELLGLLFAFIGESLTIRLLGEVWPQLPSTIQTLEGDKK